MNFGNIIKGKQKTSQKSSKKTSNQEYFLTINGEQQNVTEYVNGDAIFAELFKERQDLVSGEGLSGISGTKNLLALMERMEELSTNSTATVGDVIKEAKAEKIKETKTSPKRKEKEEAGPEFEEKDAIVELFQVNTQNGKFNWVMTEKALVDGSWKNIPVMVHSNNMLSSLVDRCREGTQLGGILVWDEGKKRYNLMYAKHIADPKGENNQQIFDAWLAENTVVSTEGMTKVTPVEIRKLITGVTRSQLEATLKEKFPNGVAVKHGSGHQMELYIEK